MTIINAQIDPYLPYLAIGLILIFLISKISKRKKQFNNKPLQEIAAKDHDSLTKVLGRQYNAFVFRGFERIGKLKGGILYQNIKTIQEITDKNNKKTEEVVSEPVALFKIRNFSNNFLIDTILKILSDFGFGTQKFAIDKKIISVDNEGNLHIDESTTLLKFAEIWVSSREGRKMITEFGFKYAYESAIEESVNMCKRVSYYAPFQAAIVERIEASGEQERKKWEQYRENELGD